MDNGGHSSAFNKVVLLYKSPGQAPRSPEGRYTYHQEASHIYFKKEVAYSKDLFYYEL